MAILLERRPDQTVTATEYDGAEPGEQTTLAAEQVPSFVAAREAQHPRWVWNDTFHWYPMLLSHGVRVERCWDLRMCHRALAGSPHAQIDSGSAGEYWSTQPSPTAREDADTLFSLTDSAPSGRTAPDAAAEWQRQLDSVAASPRPRALRLLLSAESAGMLCAREMEFVGIPWRAETHREILRRLLGPRPANGLHPLKLQRLAARVRSALDAPRLGLDRPTEVLEALKAAGVPATSTRAHELERLDHPALAPLLEYKWLYRIWSASGWSWLDTWVHEGRFRPEYVVAGVVSGRWAAHGGGALQIPKVVRPAVAADEGWTFVIADVGQLEPRVLAGLASDERMAAAGRSGDLYAGMVETGVVPDRSAAKVAMLGALYGSTSGDSARLVPRLAQAFPRSMAFVDAAASAGEAGRVVSSLLGRGSPNMRSAWWAPAETPSQRRAAREWGRFARNFVVQSTAAEWALCWLGEIRHRLRSIGDGGWAERPHLVYFLHDEVVVHAPRAVAEETADAVRECAQAAGRHLFGRFELDFPVDVRIDSRYAAYAEAVDGHGRMGQADESEEEL